MRRAGLVARTGGEKRCRQGFGRESEVYIYIYIARLRLYIEDNMKWILKEQDRRTWRGWVWLSTGMGIGFCEHCIYHLRFIRLGEFPA